MELGFGKCEVEAELEGEVEDKDEDEDEDGDEDEDIKLVEVFVTVDEDVGGQLLKQPCWQPLSNKQLLEIGMLAL